MKPRPPAIGPLKSMNHWLMDHPEIGGLLFALGVVASIGLVFYVLTAVFG